MENSPVFKAAARAAAAASEESKRSSRSKKNVFIAPTVPIPPPPPSHSTPKGRIAPSTINHTFPSHALYKHTYPHTDQCANQAAQRWTLKLVWLPSLALHPPPQNKHWGGSVVPHPLHYLRAQLKTDLLTGPFSQASEPNTALPSHTQQSFSSPSPQGPGTSPILTPFPKAFPTTAQFRAFAPPPAYI